MRVATQIVEHVFGSAERTLGIDYPIGAEQRAEPRGKRSGCLEMRQPSVKSQLALSVE